MGGGTVAACRPLQTYQCNGYNGYRSQGKRRPPVKTTDRYHRKEIHCHARLAARSLSRPSVWRLVVGPDIYDG
eukprot:1155687-Pelagomonas_calceolata.AAC.5